MVPAAAREIAVWVYEAPLAAPSLEALLDPANTYFAAYEDGALVGYCCFGRDARVPGQDEDPAFLDVGWGLRPDLVGQGRGRAFVERILELGRRELAPAGFRVAISNENERSKRVAERVGFRRAGRAGDHVVMTRTD